MINIISVIRDLPVGKRPIEIVERKGLGHPDSICDNIMESVSVALSQEYLKRFGSVMHHNIDKGLLVAGRSQKKFGGGKVLEPMKLFFGDRATFRVGEEEIPVKDIAVETAKEWIKNNLRFVDPEKHMKYFIELKQGSEELTDIFKRKVLGANDTSAAVGYAPLTTLEKMVLRLEQYMNSPPFKKIYPEVGEDIKIMGIRENHSFRLTAAVAMVDRFIENEKNYFRKKEEVLEEMRNFVRENFDINPKLYLNTLDKEGRGLGGVYLSVTGTSAEDADCGEVGRGNRVNGLISLNRPLGTEAAAGKNPVSHVGKIYNFLTHKIAKEIYSQIPGIEEVYIWLCSQIGKPISQPQIVSAEVILKDNTTIEEIKPEVKEIIDKALTNINDFTKKLTEGEFPVC